MTPETLEQILVDEFGANKENGQVELPRDKRLTLLVIAGESIMPIDRMRRIGFTTDFVTVVTEEERYFLDVEHILGVRQDDFEERSAEARTGFHHA
ncbi:MAG: hypothetical protein ACOCV2_01325 [Persicimonas sp.]